MTNSNAIFRGRHEHILPGNKHLNGVWYEGYLADANYINPLDENYIEKLVNPDTIGQFIGVTDKNQKRIFDGDIVKHYYDPEQPEKYILGIIKWYDEQCRWAIYDSTGNPWFIRKKAVYEIIGNIYDNYELVKDFAK